MNKKTRQYIGMLLAVLSYYLIHEGAHLIYALSIGVFKQINLMTLGVQIDVYENMMTSTQMGIFCLVGVLATTITAYGLVGFIAVIKKSSSKVFKAGMYYITLVLLLLDPIYLSVLCNFVGGGDMNGIQLLLPKMTARALFGLLLLINGVVFIRRVVPQYTDAFKSE